MAGEDKTEAPTAKKLSDARKKGQLPMSKELGTAFGLLALFSVFGFAGGAMMATYKALLSDGLHNAGLHGDLTPTGVFALAAGIGMKAGMLIALPVMTVGVVGTLVGLLQSRFNFATQALKPDFKKLNPVSGLKRMFGPKGLFEVGKELIKITVIGFVTYRVLWPKRPELAQVVGMPPADMMPYLAGLCFTLGMSVAGAYIALAVADYLFQRWQTMKDLRMTKEEVRQEFKQMDVNPEVKQAMKRRQREAAQRRMLQDIPQADVIITNPTHYAVALKYDPGEPAPRVIAKGMDRVALKIRELAIDHDVQIVESPPLARSLHASVEIGHWVPEELFVAVAEVLAFVFKRRDERR